MKNRADLQKELEEILGSKKVWFQPPSKLSYPCIIYNKANYSMWYGNDTLYRDKPCYTLTLISQTADNDDICRKLMSLQYCRYDRRFVNDNLYHDVFTIYY